NIHSGKDLFWRNRLEEMADFLADTNADIIGLQEVHQNRRLGYQAAFLAEALHYSFAFAPALPVADGHFGNALLTRYPITQTNVQFLHAGGEPRALLDVTIHSASNEPLNLLVTHCSLDQKSREKQWGRIRQMVDEKKDTPLILLGDFNSVQAQFDPILKDCAEATEQKKRSTIVWLRKRLDYIFVSSHWRILDYAVLPVKWSDHYPIMSIVELSASPRLHSQ
ncbi:MAG: endonuclease/exonuclease/phosphatase family protein, partial [Clostridia bacterium]